eukprot:1144291-Rhodomonas_salina.1
MSAPLVESGIAQVLSDHLLSPSLAPVSPIPSVSPNAQDGSANVWRKDPTVPLPLPPSLREPLMAAPPLRPRQVASGVRSLPSAPRSDSSTPAKRSESER